MALVKCRECPKKISNTAETCPHCGAPGYASKTPVAAPAAAAPPQREASKNIGCGTLLAIVVGGGIVLAQFLPDSPPPPPPTAEQKEQDAASNAIFRARSAVAAQMKDPDSAQFRNFYVVKNDVGGLIVCGEVNSKNSFGAMAGFGKFVWSPELTVHEESAGGADFAKVWNATCAKFPAILSRKQ